MAAEHNSARGCAGRGAQLHLVLDEAGVEVQDDVCHEEEVGQQVGGKHPVDLRVGRPAVSPQLVMMDLRVAGYSKLQPENPAFRADNPSVPALQQLHLEGCNGWATGLTKTLGSGSGRPLAL